MCNIEADLGLYPRPAVRAMPARRAPSPSEANATAGGQRRGACEIASSHIAQEGVLCNLEAPIGAKQQHAAICMHLLCDTHGLEVCQMPASDVLGAPAG